MRITYLGQELDTTKEYELNSEKEFGFKNESIKEYKYNFKNGKIK